MVFFVMWTNQIHKWSHLEPEETPMALKVLQRLHLILPPGHHQLHHTAPFDRYYCITTGWLNWPLTKLGFYRHSERLVTALFGLIPRRDDIGLKAALQMAPLVLAEKPAGPPSRRSLSPSLPTSRAGRSAGRPRAGGRGSARPPRGNAWGCR